MEQILQIFGANTDVNTVVRKNLVYPVRTRYVRMIKDFTSRYLSFRCEFYGCPIPKGGVLPTLVTSRTTPGATPHTTGVVTPNTTGVVTPHTTGMPNISTSICQALTIT